MRALDRILKGRGGSQLLPLVALIRGMFRNGEQGAWYDPSDFLPNWRRNLLTYTEQFDNAVWTRLNSSVSINTIISPDGTLTGDKLVENTAASSHGCGNYGSQTVTSGVTYTFSAYAKAGERSFVTLYGDVSSGRLGNGVQFSLVDGSVTKNTSNYITSATNAGNGWWRFSFTAAAVSTGAAYPAMYAGDIATFASNGIPTYTGDGTSGIYIWGAQLEVGSTATAYQKITDGIQDYYTAQAQPVLFQDSAGTAPVTAVEQPVGLMLDKSKSLALGSELITNGDFSNGATGWTLGSETTVAGGKATIASTGAASVLSQTPASFSAAKFYAVSFDATVRSGSAKLENSGGGTYVTIATTGRHNCIVTGISQVIFNRITACSIDFDNISVRELPGNHAFQSTSASRPVLSARVNLLTKTEALTDAAWQKINGGTGIAPVVTGGFTAPDGTSTAFRVQISIAAGTSGSDYSIVRQVLSGLVNTTYTNQLWVKSNTGSNQIFLLYVNNGQPLVTATSSWAQVSSSYSLGTSYFDIGTLGSTASTKVIDILVWHPDARVSNDGVGIPAYQRVNTSTDYDTAGFPLYLKTDGVDDWMQTNSINFTSTDKMTVWAGVRKLSDSATSILTELSSSSVNNGSFTINAPAAAGTYRFGANGVGGVEGAASGFVAPITNVLQTAIDLKGATQAAQITARINAAATSLSYAGSTGATGNFGNYPLYLFRRGGGSLPFNGRMYGLIVRGAQSTGTQISNGEKYVNSKTKAF